MLQQEESHDCFAYSVVPIVLLHTTIITKIEQKRTNERVNQIEEGKQSSAKMIPLLTCALLLLSLIPPSVHSYYDTRMENRGYNNDPYARDEQDDQNTMSDRGYNSDPYEVNVDGTDNLFSREESCVPDVNGMFGSEEGTGQPLDFYYQVEMLPLIVPLDDAEQANKEIISKVETSVSKTLLPSLFVEQCALTERSRRSDQRPHRQLVGMKGVTTLPEDTILAGGTSDCVMNASSLTITCMLTCMYTFLSTVDCEGELSNDLNECYVVDGTMTLYSNSAVDESFLANLQSIIRDAMTEGDYNELDPRIVNVSYRESLGEAEVSNVGSTGDSSEMGGGLPIYAWVFIAVGGLASLFTLGAIFNRCRRRHHDDNDTGSFPEPRDWVIGGSTGDGSVV